MRGLRQKIAYGHDIIAAFLSLPASLFLRLGSDLAFYNFEFVLLAAGLFAAVAAVVFWMMRLYGGVWRYASLNDLMAITKAVTLVILVFVPLLFLLNRLEWIPRSTPVINWFVLLAMLGGPRFLYRQFKDRRMGRARDGQAARRVPVILVGAGDGSEMFIRALSRNPMAAYEPVGIVGRNPGRVGRNIHGVHVLGTVDPSLRSSTGWSAKEGGRNGSSSRRKRLRAKKCSASSGWPIRWVSSLRAYPG